MTSLPWVAWISCVRLELVVICCSTLLNWTSSVVKVLASIGLEGSWFLSWVSNKLRKLPKLLLSEVSALAGLPVLGDADAVAAEMLPLMLSVSLML